MSSTSASESFGPTAIKSRLPVQLVSGYTLSKIGKRDAAMQRCSAYIEQMLDALCLLANVLDVRD
jgi:hypothetical protein